MLYDNLDVNEKGHLTFGGLDTVSLAEEYGTPLYLLDEDRVRANCRQYTAAMDTYFPAGSLPLFAGKALCFKGIYPVIQSENMGADIVSPGEMYTALAAGFPPAKMYFHGTNKSDEDIAYGLTHQVGTFVVDNLNELHVLNRMARGRGLVQDILLRVTVGLDPHTLAAINTGKVDSQFGVPIETAQAEEFLKEALSCESVNVKGFHSHIGSQIFESDSFCDQLDILLNFAADMRKKLGFTAEMFNIGGGFGVQYVELDPAVDIAGNIKEIATHLKTGCDKYGYPMPKILMEPGRSIVADAGITLYTAGGRKEITGYRNYVTVDGGMTDNPRYALYKSAYTLVNASRMTEEKEYPCTVAGRCCESGDRLAEDIQLVKPERGDILAVLTTGAYNYSMASNYNRVLRPAMVMVKSGESRLVVRRQTYEDLVACEL